MKTGDIWSRDLFNKADDGAWHEDSKEHVTTRMTGYSGVQVRDDPNDNATDGENCHDTPRVFKHVFGIDRGDEGADDRMLHEVYCRTCKLCLQFGPTL